MRLETQNFMDNCTNKLLLIFLLFGSANAFSSNDVSFGSRGFRSFTSQGQNFIPNYSSSTRHSFIISMIKDPTETEDISKSEVAKEVQELLARAKAIRDSLPEETKDTQTATIQLQSGGTIVGGSETDEESNSESSASSSVGYRLYIDIGREDGTWMDPKWGASGKRIETSIDVEFLIPDATSIENNQMDSSLADEEIISKMVKDNLSGKSSAVRILKSSSARLRGGFDKMTCYGGGYRIDAGNGGRSASSTARFFIQVDGTEEGSGYGDISIPKGCLYFSLPCFGGGMRQLSSKEGIVTVRQMGWHTGWRREESRIVGVFRAVPIEQAKKRDRF